MPRDLCNTDSQDYPSQTPNPRLEDCSVALLTAQCPRQSLPLLEMKGSNSTQTDSVLEPTLLLSGCGILSKVPPLHHREYKRLCLGMLRIKWKISAKYWAQWLVHSKHLKVTAGMYYIWCQLD